MFRTSTALCNMLFLAAAAMAQAPQSQSQPALAPATLPGTSNNAAIGYYQAIALIPENLPEGLDPNLLGYNAKVADVLEAVKKQTQNKTSAPSWVKGVLSDEEQKDRGSRDEDLLLFAPAVEALHRGSSRSDCDFGLPIEPKLNLNPAGLEKLSAVASHAVFHARTLTGQGKHGEAVIVLADLEQMGMQVSVHAGVNMATAIDIQKRTCVAVNQEISTWKSVLDGPAAGLLTSRLAKLNEQPFDASAYYIERGNMLNRRLSELVGNWSKKNFMVRKDMINALVLMMPAQGQALETFRNSLTEDLNDAPNKVHAWMQINEEQCRRAAELCKQPYAAALPQWTALDKEVDSQVADLMNTGRSANPLAAISSNKSDMALSATLCSATMRAQTVAAAAITVQLRTRKYPPTIADLAAPVAKLVGQIQLPKDPFTGEDFKYELKNGCPVIQSSWTPADPELAKRMPVLDLDVMIPKPPPKATQPASGPGR